MGNPAIELRVSIPILTAQPANRLTDQRKGFRIFALWLAGTEAARSYYNDRVVNASFLVGCRIYHRPLVITTLLKQLIPLWPGPGEHHSSARYHN